MLAFVVCKIC